MPVTHVSEIGAESQHQKTTAPVSVASDMQFGTEFFCYQFLVKNKTCSMFVQLYGTSFWHAFSAPILVGLRGVSRRIRLNSLRRCRVSQ